MSLAYPATIDSEANRAELDAIDDQLTELARDDINAFVTSVIKDEKTGIPLVQSSIHEAWHDLADQYDRLLLWSHVEAGKTTQMAIARTLWMLGRDPSLRIGILSNTHPQAEKIVRTIARYIEQSQDLKRVFPKLRASEPWHATALTVQRPYLSKDPSIQAFGVHGNVLGSRLDHLIIDDVLDPENTRTPSMRDDLWAWYNATLPGRLTRTAKVLCIGTAFHPEDLMHKLAGSPGWNAVRYPVVDDKDGTPRWPEQWPLDRIEKRRLELCLTPAEFARQMLCIARDDASARFKQAWIDECLRGGDEVPKTLRNIGQWNGQRCLGITVNPLPQGYKTYTGVDLAVQQKDSADLTVFFHVLVDSHDNRYVLDVEAGRWSGPEIVSKIIDSHRRYLSLVIVENNAAQDFILQFTRSQAALPLRAFTTGRNKAHPEFGIESLAGEMANGKWRIPTAGKRPSPEANAWIQEMLRYDPADHTGDRLMASWFAKEGIRMGEIKAETGRIDLMSR